MRKLKSRLIAIIMTSLLLASSSLFAQEISVSTYYYSQLKDQFDLSSRNDFTYLKVDYLPQGGPANMTQVVSASFTDSRPSNFTAVNTGFIAAGSSSVRETVYIFYSGKDDSLIFASTGKSQFIKNSLKNFGLGTSEERLKAFNKAKNPDIIEPAVILVDKLVNEGPVKYGALVLIVVFVAIALGAGLSLYIAYKWMVRFITSIFR